MKKYVFSLLSVMLILVLLTTPAGAGGGIKLSSAFTLGSLIDTGFATGLGKTDWRIELDASGTAAVTCINNGSNPAPGQSSPKIEGKGTQDIPSTQVTKNGKAYFTVEAVPPEELNPIISWDAGGCPNSNWTAMISFVFWNHAFVYVIDPATGLVAATFEYNCVTTRTGPNSTPSTFDDGTVSCTQIN